MSNRVGLNAGLFQLVPVTATWTVPFTLYSIFLSARVFKTRIDNEQWMGDRLQSTPISSSSSSVQNDPLFTRIKAHSNFVENVPYALLLASIAEMNGGSKKNLNIALGVLLVLRVMHAEIGLLKKDSLAIGRPIGYVGTLAWLGGVAGYASYLVRGYWGY